MISITINLPLSKEWEYLVLAKVLIMQQEYAAALALLDALVEQGQQAGRNFLVVRAIVLQALALHAQGATEQAFDRLTLSFEIAAPEGLRRVFLDHDELMLNLLEEYLLARPPAAPVARFIMKLLELAGTHSKTNSLEPTDRPLEAPTLPLASGGRVEIEAASAPGELVEALTEREYEVLRLLVKTDLSSTEIARQLTVAVSTVRTHIRSIYTKVDVQNRWQLGRRSEELNLL